VFGIKSGAELPALVRRYLERVLPAGGAVPREVRVRQAGEMWLKPGGRRLRFTALEQFAVDQVAFPWRARFPIVPLVSLRVVDRYASGEGSLEGRLFRLVPVMRASGPELSVGAAMRYLAELPWVPHAILANPELEWRELDAHTAEVATPVGSARAAVRLSFDAAGDVVGAFADARPRPEGKASVPTPVGWRLPRLRRARRHPRSAASGGHLGAPGGAIHLLARNDRLARTQSSAQGDPQRRPHEKPVPSGTLMSGRLTATGRAISPAG
jgi:Family of unknown function (DUF6544)